MTIPEYDQCDCGIRGPHAWCRPKLKTFGSGKPNKYQACQEGKHNGLPSCDPECMDAIARDATEKNSRKSPSDRIMSTIREEVNETLAAAKLAGYRQAQLEEFHHLCGITNAEIIERIMHLRKELGLDIIKNR